MIKQFNAAKDAAAWRPVASKAPATKQPGDEAENQEATARRLARQLLRLHLRPAPPRARPDLYIKSSHWFICEGL